MENDAYIHCKSCPWKGWLNECSVENYPTVIGQENTFYYCCPKCGSIIYSENRTPYEKPKQ